MKQTLPGAAPVNPQTTARVTAPQQYGVPGSYKGVAPGSAGAAYSALTRDQWYTYVNTFIPIENKLIEYATDPGVVANAMSRASADTTASFDAARAGAARRLRGPGVTLSGDERKAADRSYSLARSLADIGAQNTARDATIQRQQSILGNPSPDQIQI